MPHQNTLRALAALALALLGAGDARGQLAPATNADNLTIFRNIPATYPVLVALGGAFTVGDRVGFNYQFTHAGNGYNETVAYTVGVGDGLDQVLAGILADLKTNHPNITNAWSAEGCPENVVTAAVFPMAGGQKQLGFNQCWPMVGTASITPFVTGAHTETVTITGGGDRLEAYPIALACGKNVPGRGTKPGDLFCGMYFYGPDSSGGPYGFMYSSDPQQGFPYIQIIPEILNATYGQWDARLTFIFGSNHSIELGAGHILIDGQTVSDVTAWTPYTPTISCGSGSVASLGAVSGRFKQRGKSVEIAITIPVVTNGSCAQWIAASLPAPAASAATKQTLVGRENQKTGTMLLGLINEGGGATLIENYLGQYPASDGTIISVGGTYERQ